MASVYRHLDPATAALTILGFVVASYGLGRKSLWVDEAASVNHARLGLSGLWKVISGGDPNMGLYYLLLHFWVRVFGFSEAATRSMSVVLAGLAVPAMVLLGRRLFGHTAGLAAGLLLALSPCFVQYEQTARSYALVVLLVLLSSYLFVAELDKPSGRTRAAYVLVSAAAVYTHYFAALVVLVHAVTLLVLRRGGALRREWITVGVAFVCLCIPAGVFASRAGTGGISWVRKPGLHNLLALPVSLTNGGHALALGLSILACYGFARGPRDRYPWRAAFVAAWLVLPVLLVFMVSEVGRPLFITYYLIIVLPALVLLAAAGLVKLPGRAAGVTIMVALISLSAKGVVNWYSANSHEDFRLATRYILGNERVGDGISYWPARAASQGVTYYEKKTGVRGPTPVAIGDAPAVGRRRIWLVTRDSDTSLQQRGKLTLSLTGAYEPVGAPALFRGLTVTLYRAR